MYCLILGRHKEYITRDEQVIREAKRDEDNTFIRSENPEDFNRLLNYHSHWSQVPLKKRHWFRRLIEHLGLRPRTRITRQGAIDNEHVSPDHRAQ